MPQPDPLKRQAFSRKMTDILNYGALNLAIAIGYRTGLFEAMAALNAPASAADIAAAAGLHPRYVREWLGIMTTGRIVELSPASATTARYHLPSVHADFLCRHGDETNFAVYTQEIPLLTQCAMDPVISAFASGAGVPYRHYPRFQAFMNELARAKHETMLVEEFLPSVDRGRLLERLQRGIVVCDLGCGEGVALNRMAEAFPESRFVGLDIDPNALAVGRKAAREKGLTNATFIQQDATRIREDPSLAGAFHYITAFDSIHDQSAPLEALRNIRYALASDGIFSMIDIAAGSEHRDNLEHPMGPFLYCVSLLHCLPVGLVDAGAGLGMMWGTEQALELLGQAGFTEIKLLEMEFDPFNRHYQCRR